LNYFSRVLILIVSKKEQWLSLLMLRLYSVKWKLFESYHRVYRKTISFLNLCLEDSKTNLSISVVSFAKEGKITCQRVYIFRAKIFYLLNYGVVVQSMPVPDRETFHSESTYVKLNLARSRCISLLLLRKEVRCL